jgi:hypothetical protein
MPDLRNGVNGYSRTRVSLKQGQNLFTLITSIKVQRSGMLG